MPNYRVTIQGKTYEVQVPDPSERPVRAIVDGQVFEVHVQPEPGASDATGLVPVMPMPSPKHISSIPGAPATPTPPPAAAGAGEVTAPLPGTIVSISVAAGDTINYGQELCVLEAMKMNNPIRSTQTGRVTEILVSIGQQVQHGAPLMVIAEA